MREFQRTTKAYRSHCFQYVSLFALLLCLLDNIDKAILLCLAEDARVSLFRARPKVGVIGPAVAEHVRRLEEMEVIPKTTQTINSAAVEY